MCTVEEVRPFLGGPPLRGGVIVAKTKTSTAVKNRYNAKAYDQLPVRIHKGRKEVIQAHAESRGESLNGFVVRAIDETMQRDKTVV